MPSVSAVLVFWLHVGLVHMAGFIWKSKGNIIMTQKLHLKQYGLMKGLALYYSYQNVMELVCCSCILPPSTHRPLHHKAVNLQPLSELCVVKTWCEGQKISIRVSASSKLFGSKGRLLSEKSFFCVALHCSDVNSNTKRQNVKTRREKFQQMVTMLADTRSNVSNQEENVR